MVLTQFHIIDYNEDIYSDSFLFSLILYCCYILIFGRKAFDEWLMQLWFPLHEVFADVSRFIKRLFFKLTLICNLSLAPAQTKLWVPRRCSASTIALLLPWQQRVRQPGLPPPSVSSILGVYFWVTAERLNVFALLAPAAPLKSKLEIRIRTTDSWRPKPGLKFKSVAKGLIHLCRRQ